MFLGRNQPNARRSTDREFLEVRIDEVRLMVGGGAAILKWFEHLTPPARAHLVGSGNARTAYLMHHSEQMRAFIGGCDVVRVDGEGFRLLARLGGSSVPPRSTWADFGWDLVDDMAGHDRSLFLLGGRPTTNEAAARAMLRRRSALRVVGRQHGYWDRDSNEANALVLAKLESARPDVVIVALGMPEQERWLWRYRHELPPAVYMTAGGALDYLSGEVRRGPAALTNHGMEWLARMLAEPRRLGPRYLREMPTLAHLALTQLAQGLRSRSTRHR